MTVPAWKQAFEKQAAGDNPVAKDMRQKLTKISRELSQCGSTALSESKKDSSWSAVFSLCEKAEAAVDNLRSKLFDLG